MTIGGQEGFPAMASEPPRPGKAPLRVALLIDSNLQPRWKYKIISDIIASPFANLVLIVQNAAPEEEAQTYSQKVRNIFEDRKHFLYKVYTRLDDRFFREEPDAFERVSIEPWVSEIPHVEVKPIKKKFSDEFPAGDAAAIREYGLDVALRFGFRILKGQALQIARYGVWSYHHGDNLRYRGGPPGFWEVMKGDPSTGAILQILTDELDNGHVIYRSFAQTDLRSVRRNANNYYWQSSAFFARKLRDVYQTGFCALRDPLPTCWTPYSHKLYKAPSNLAMCSLLARFGARYLMSKMRNLLRFRQWFIAYRINANASFLDDTFYRFKRLIPPKDRFWADPFPFKRDGKFYIFFEELLYETGKGHLSVVEVDQKGIVHGPHKILERPYHLSYPFLFEWNGELYMVPESSKARTVELYRCTSFPDQWEMEKVLLHDLEAVDATLAEIEGRWWMFVGVEAEGTKFVYELHLYYADSPLGPWHPHRANPVRPDAQSSRPAGRIVRQNGSYYRPAQEGPGYAMSIQKIERLDEEEYLETEVSRIEPSWAENLAGTHTLNSADGLTVIDGLVYRRRIF
jgi:hypothetical protein